MLAYMEAENGAGNNFSLSGLLETFEGDKTWEC